MVGWPPHLHTQGSFPFPLLCSSSRFTSNFLKATFLTDLQTEPYAELQISKVRLLQVEGKIQKLIYSVGNTKGIQDPFGRITHCYCWVHYFFQSKLLEKMFLSLYLIFLLSCVSFLSQTSLSPSFYSKESQGSNLPDLPLCCTSLYFHLCITGYS